MEIASIRSLNFLVCFFLSSSARQVSPPSVICIVMSWNRQLSCGILLEFPYEPWYLGYSVFWDQAKLSIFSQTKIIRRLKSKVKIRDSP
ncbi:hypothetical protein BKA64DRAFT_114034 [Cadophora sp. MPI-SDFR-AT-0126]|nr:hypothetical protein BKA64DRAFT_114034 [Leotiomycetes sp. MPI-SDFR-AT-0126]